MGDKKIKVAMVFPVHNRRELTLQCLRSVEKINREGIELHIVLVDDGSTDGTSEAVGKDFPDVQIIEGDGNLWYSEGINVGVRAALKDQPDYIMLMNDDQVFDSECLQYMVETAEKYPRSVVGAVLLLWDQPHKLFQVSPEWETLAGGWRHWVHQTIWMIPDKPWKVDIIVGNCQLVPREAFEECGLMNSKKLPMVGDAEFTPRLKKNGFTLLIEPRARVFCQPNDVPPKFSKLSVKEKIRGLLIDRRHPHNLKRRFFAYMQGAPSKLHGLTAFGVFYLRAIFKINYENKDFSANNTEVPLKEKFARSVIGE